MPETKRKPTNNQLQKKRNSGRKPPAFLAKYLEDFCQAIYAGHNCTAASVLAGRTPHSGWYLNRRKDVQARLKEIAEEYKDEGLQRAIENRFLKIQFLDENLMDVIANGEGKGKKGRAAALLIGYKSKFLVDPPNPQTLIQLRMESGQQTNAQPERPKLFESARFARFREKLVLEANNPQPPGDSEVNA